MGVQKKKKKEDNFVFKQLDIIYRETKAQMKNERIQKKKKKKELCASFVINFI